MMQSKTREYNWRDIMRLIQADCGLNTEQVARVLSEAWFVGGFKAPEIETQTIVRVMVYDKPYTERMKEHTE